VQTTITDIGTSTANPSNTATVAAATANLSATENSQFSGVLGTVSGNSANVTGVTINWGDGTTSTGTYGSGSSSFTISGVHTYSDDALYNLSVTVTMSPGPNLTAAGPAVVADASLSGSASNFTPTVGVPLGFVAGTSDNPVTVASFSDGNTSAPATDFTASINWGDGTTSAGTVSGSAGSYSVAGNHSYVKPGAFTITTTVTDVGSSTVSLQGTATVGIIEGQEYDAVLSISLPDPVTTSPPSAYTASLTWGDGSSSSATATPVYQYTNGALTGSLLVTATHVYASSGSFTVTASATNPNTGNNSTGTLSLTVADAILNAIPQSVSAVAGSSTGTVTVGQFEDANPSATITPLSATINWGDGSGTTTGTVVATSTPGLFSVQGSHTYSTAANDTITVSVSDTGGKSVTITSSAKVSSAWTLLSSGSPSSDPSRGNLITLGNEQVDLSQGAVRVSHSLDFDLSPGNRVGGSPSVVYNSATVSPRPVIQFELQSDPNTSNAAATQYQVVWSFNNVNQTTQTFTVSSYQAGAIYLFAVQVGSAITATGVYPWSATITITRSDHTTVQLTPSGYVPVVVRDASVFGAGWGISSIDQLYPISANGTVPAGLLWVTGSGDSRFFVGTGPYTNAEDFGTLVQSGSNYVYTDPQQNVETFNSSGFETSYAPPSGLDTTYTVTSGKVTGVTAYDGGSTTINYDTHGIFQGISEPGSRTFTVSQTDTEVGGVWEGVLNSITDVDSTTRSFGYSGHDMTSDSWSPLYVSMTFSGTTGLLTGLTRGQSTTTVPYTIASAAGADLTSTSTLSIGAGLPVPVPISATIEDGNNHTTTYYVDLRNRLIELKDALGNATLNQLNSAGDTVLSVDPLGRVTANTFDSYGDVTKTVSADGSFTINQYDSTYHELTQSTNSLGETTTNTYNSGTGLIASSADALGNTTIYVWSGGLLQSQTDPLGHIVLDRYDSHDRQIAQIDSLGNWSQTNYDGYGNVASTINALGWKSLTSGTARGLVTSTTDPNGDVTSTAYYADGDVHTVTNAQGFASTTTIDVRGLTTSQTDNLGNATSYGFDSAGNQTSSTDPNGNATNYTFDADNRQTAVTDPLSNETQTQFDADNNVTATIDPAGNTTHFYVDLQNRQVMSVDPLGNVAFSVFDPAGNTLAAISPQGAFNRSVLDSDNRVIASIDPLGNTSQTQFNAGGQVVATLDPMSNATHYLYTSSGQQAAVIDPSNLVSKQTYNALGQVTQKTDAAGRITKFGYDMNGLQNSTADYYGNTSEVVYSITGATLENIDQRGNVTKMTLDGDNRITTVTDGSSNVTKTTYDGDGNTISSTDGNAKTTNFTYTKDNQVASTTDPNANITTDNYSNTGKKLAGYAGNGNGSFSGYNADGQATGSGQATGASTVTTYTPTGQVATVTDPDGNLTVFLYNVEGQEVASIDPLGHVNYIGYNADSQVSLTVDADGRSIQNSYTPNGRLSSESWLAANGAQTDSESFGYDNAGNVTSESNNYGSYTWQYDSANRVSQQTDPFSMTLTPTYDAAGNVTQLSDNAGGTLTSVYNNDNLLTSRRFSETGAQARIDLTYTPDNQINTESRYSDTAGNNLVGTTQYSYDPATNITEIKHKAGSTTLEDFQYTYNSANLISSETDTISGTGTTTNYSYDASNQLTAAGSASYSYDSNGNRSMTGYQTGADNQIKTDGTWNYAYDNVGNLIQKTGVAGGSEAGYTWQYSFDNSNRMTSASEYNGSTVVVQELNFYAVNGNRVEQDVTQSGTTTVTKFSYDLSGNVIADLNSTNGVVTRRMFLDATDSVFARISSGGTLDFYLPDHLGSIRGLESTGGTLDDAITFDAFGNKTSESSPSNGDRYGYTGREWDLRLTYSTIARGITIQAADAG
jgi:YD repeat-containing protein